MYSRTFDVEHRGAENEASPATIPVELGAAGSSENGGHPWVFQSGPVLIIGHARGADAGLVAITPFGDTAGEFRRMSFRGVLSLCCKSLLGVFMIAMALLGLIRPCGICFFYGYAWIVWLTSMRDACDERLNKWLGIYLVGSFITWAFRAKLLQKLSQRNPNDRLPLSIPEIRVLELLNFIGHLFWMLYGRDLWKKSLTYKETDSLFSFVQCFSFLGVLFYGFATSVLLVWFFIRAARNHALLWMARNGMLHWAARRDLLYHRIGASPEAIDKIEVVAYDAEMFADPLDQDDARPQGDCCICLETYDNRREIKRTRCGHFMHSECLEIWLRAARTCPTCRCDLEVRASVIPSDHASA